jgi:hypothetical protein
VDPLRGGMRLLRGAVLGAPLRPHAPRFSRPSRGLLLFIGISLLSFDTPDVDLVGQNISRSI